MKKKVIALVLVCVLVFGIAVGGTLAWLAAETDTVTNTFTIGDINIKLTETARTYKMVPGVDLPKDPTVTVKGGSEACWLFVKVQETNVTDFLTYTVNTTEGEWKALDGQSGVYYREVASSNSDQPFTVLTGNKVTVKSGVTKAQLTAATGENAPKLSFTAYAVQKEGVANAAAAWEKIGDAVLSTDWVNA